MTGQTKPALAPEILSSLSVAVQPLFTAQGLTEKEASGLLLSSTNSNPLNQLAQRLEDFPGNFFPLEMGGTETAAQLLTESKCVDLSDGIVAQFPVTPSETKVRRILELVNFGREASDDEVTALYKESGCETANYEAGFRFAIKFPDVQRSRLVVFRPEPLWRDRDRFYRTLVLRGCDGQREVGADYVDPRDRRWIQRCWFARFRRFE